MHLLIPALALLMFITGSVGWACLLDELVFRGITLLLFSAACLCLLINLV